MEFYFRTFNAGLLISGRLMDGILFFDPRFGSFANFRI